VRLFFLELLGQRFDERRVTHVIDFTDAADERSIETDDHRIHGRDHREIAADRKVTVLQGRRDVRRVHLGRVALPKLCHGIADTSRVAPLGPWGGGVDGECHEMPRQKESL
jgi:hypothetical protein